MRVWPALRECVITFTLGENKRWQVPQKSWVQRSLSTPVVAQAAECNVDGNFFAKPACQPLLLLHGGQAFFHGRKESVVIFSSFWFFSDGSRLCPPAVGQADYWRRHVPVQKNKEILWWRLPCFCRKKNRHALF